GVLGPDGIDDLLTVEAVTRRQRQDLHQGRGVAAGPARGRDGLTVDGDREAAEQLHLDRGHGSIVAGHARRGVTISSRRSTARTQATTRSIRPRRAATTKPTPTAASTGSQAPCSPAWMHDETTS